MALPALPAEGNQNWYTHYAALDAAARNGTDLYKPNVTDISGTTGVRSSTTFLRGDGTWANPPGGTSTTPGANMANESAAGIATTNTGATNRANWNTWTAANPGVPLFIRAGAYDMSGTVFPKGPVYGAGPGSTVLRFPAQSTGSLYVATINDITIADLEIRCTSATGPGVQGANSASSNHLTFDTVDRFTARNVYCNGGANIGIMMLRARYGHVTGCNVVGTWRDGIHADSFCDWITISDNVVSGTGDDCIAVIATPTLSTAPRRVTITGNTVQATTARGITVQGGIDCTVTGNVITGASGFGILLGSWNSTDPDTFPSINTTVTGNIIRDVGQTAIHVAGQNSGTLIADNVIKSPGLHGIAILHGRPQIIGNSVDDVAQTGILLTVGGALLDETVILNNTVRRAGQRGIYTQSCSKLTINGNVVQENNTTALTATTWGAIQCDVGSSLMVVGNRVDGASTTRTPNAIQLFNVTNALVTNNATTTVTNAYVSSGTTSGVTTANNVIL